jgi:hypothetical protein
MSFFVVIPVSLSKNWKAGAAGRLRRVGAYSKADFGFASFLMSFRLVRNQVLIYLSEGKTTILDKPE